MLSVRSLLAISALAAGVAAQTGYGRFPCTIVNGDNTFSPDQTQCAPDFLVAPGDASEDGTQGNGATPTGDVRCQLETETGAYFCGIAGAACTADTNCDNGRCDLTSGTCQGGFTQGCAGTDAFCSGYLYCLSGDFSVTPSNTCGALGAFCQDAIAVDPSSDAAAAQPIFNQFCAGQGNYCNSGLGTCDTVGVAGSDCSTDPDFKCGAGLTCNPTTLVCVVDTTPIPTTVRARERRAAAHTKKSLCPASHSACAVEGARGFECVDTTTSLEQCGACAANGGQDCTALPNVASVGCVAGVCEIWACEEGFSFDASLNACAAN